MQTPLVLVSGPLVEASSWSPTAELLSHRGWRVQVPDVLSAASPIPAWRDWSSHLKRLITTGEAPILVGHSAASVFIAELASQIPVRALVIVDGLIPPEHGKVAPATAPIVQMLRNLADASGNLPPWSDWWKTEPRASQIGVTAFAQNPCAYALFRSGLPRMKLAWFNDEINLAPWNDIPAGYVICTLPFDPKKRLTPLRQSVATSLVRPNQSINRTINRTHKAVSK
jgi:pimeloyl-ACP methyl ester carboxylesterase